MGRRGLGRGRNGGEAGDVGHKRRSRTSRTDVRAVVAREAGGGDERCGRGCGAENADAVMGGEGKEEDTHAQTHTHAHVEVKHAPRLRADARVGASAPAKHS